MQVYSPFDNMTKKEKLEFCDILTESQFSTKEVSEQKKIKDNMGLVAEEPRHSKKEESTTNKVA